MSMKGENVLESAHRGETMTQLPAMRVALIGSGRMGSFHGGTVARRLPGVTLAAVADPAPGAAERLATEFGAPTFATDPAEVCTDPDIDAVVIAAPARFHADLVVAAAAAGKSVFCEKPMALTLADADRAMAAAHQAGVVLQVGFNRRFAPDWAAARTLLDDGRLGKPRLLRSVTRDPGGFDPARVAPNAIFLETLIHDFDALRFLNPGANAVEVYATATALVEPAWKDRGLLDTAVVIVRFDNGAVGTAEACFEASYGYDVRGEVFGSGGMATMGDGRRTGMRFSGTSGVTAETVRSDQELFAGAYVAELAAFIDAVRSGTAAPVTGADARAALEIALTAAESVESGGPVRIAELAG
jgi:myo-inositol 2-dehydrogenase/D-chiro-inositol 1-dehydrogenase